MNQDFYKQQPDLIKYLITSLILIAATTLLHSQNFPAGFSQDIPDATASAYKATTAGAYKLRVTQAGVHAWSSIVNINVNQCIEEDEDPSPEQSASLTSVISNDFQMKVFPNPNNGQFTIVLNMATAQEETIKMKIVKVIGQQIYNKKYIASSDYLQEVVELDNTLPTGIYTLQVMIG